MSGEIKTPLIYHDAMALVMEAAPNLNVRELASLTVALIRVDQASREQTCTANDALLVTSHRALLIVNEWLLSAYTDDKPIHPGAHHLLSETVQAVLDRFEKARR